MIYVNQALNYKQGLDFALKPCNLNLTENKGLFENPRTKTLEKILLCL